MCTCLRFDPPAKRGLQWWKAWLVRWIVNVVVEIRYQPRNWRGCHVITELKQQQLVELKVFEAVVSRLLRMRRGRRRRRLEALQQECGVHYERYRQSDQCVHKDVQLGLSKSVLSEPFQHFLFRHDVTCNIKIPMTFVVFLIFFHDSVVMPMLRNATQY